MSVPRALERSVLVDDQVAGLKRAALPQAAGESGFLQHQASDHDALASALTAASGKHCHPNAVCSDTLDFADAFDKYVGHAGRIYQFGKGISHYSQLRGSFRWAIVGCNEGVRLPTNGNTVNSRLGWKIVGVQS
ncbi:MAG: hypothetical protein KDJ71_14085 [Nitrobacter sp.]|nr:hypothetical protein [Nitrobacter sp.]